MLYPVCVPFMHIESVRDGIKKTLDFEKGYSVSELRREQSSEPSNTYVHFLIDEEVFDDIKISGSEIVDFLRDAAITVPGLECKICDERDDNAHTLLYRVEQKTMHWKLWDQILYRYF